MFRKPEDARMTKEESEEYGRKINAQSAKFENVEFASEATPDPEEVHTTKLSEDEIKKRVGSQNYKNMKDGDIMNSINS